MSEIKVYQDRVVAVIASQGETSLVAEVTEVATADLFDPAPAAPAQTETPAESEVAPVDPAATAEVQPPDAAGA